MAAEAGGGGLQSEDKFLLLVGVPYFLGFCDWVSQCRCEAILEVQFCNKRTIGANHTRVRNVSLLLTVDSFGSSLIYVLYTIVSIPYPI